MPPKKRCLQPIMHANLLRLFLLLMFPTCFTVQLFQRKEKKKTFSLSFTIKKKKKILFTIKKKIPFHEENTTDQTLKMIIVSGRPSNFDFESIIIKT